ncbi:MAG: YesL family protein [Lachnospiraceae bacterium]|nr:YesL family protein [Lachnospiraceae bacterium]
MSEKPGQKFIDLMNKTGQLVILGLLFILTSIPVVTAGSSCCALYYSVVKSVRRGRGYPTKEYFRAFLKNLPKGIIFSLFFIAFFTTMLYNTTSMLRIAAAAAMAGFALWLFPVTSRFEKKFTELVMLTFVVTLRFWYVTLLLAGAGGLLIYLFMYTGFLPLMALPFLPGLWTYFSSFLIEKGLKRYQPKEAPEGVDAWWLED